MAGEDRMQDRQGPATGPTALERWTAQRVMNTGEGLVQGRDSSGHPASESSWDRIQTAARTARPLAPSTELAAARDRLQAALQGSVPTALGANPGDPAVTGGRGRPSGARQALAALGGIAGARAIADHLRQHEGVDLTVRQIRDRFRHTGGSIRKLGAGYFALRSSRVPTVAAWAEARLGQGGAEAADSLINAIMLQYPNGDRRAVAAWLYQDPGPLTVRQDTVFVVQRPIRPR